ncbi:sugar ABC transporter permease [Cohnella faecalis]|uniref:Sugar ABC transporter permease n=1 Tax=Cohnella faecalis TaxID=2315694 RepID=A0A398CCE8_9BACL|nr:sugar ABC transporter permease [Cohnella faecalis]
MSSIRLSSSPCGRCGTILIIYLAALQGVPHEMREAMMIDGAGKWKTFIHLTLPMIARA